ncbi:endothelial cell-specific chemotaxis regulator isoform X3 [Dipodomys spectabilis]|uniref:endothelial cell-specific chemotaxis regulator isoform X3 n=1 Tax=Dipodomys spectabilis TaxID=105255 RepID=UPI001C536378|nr:endothelial cell-specific chemotaxis regulator isoform X3 [Dipodomys spectabilis]
MGTTGATQLFWAILGLLLLQGHNSQPTTTQTSQGVFNSLRLTIEATLPNTGNQSSSEPGSPKILSSTSAPGTDTGTPHSSSSTKGETSQNATPSSITTSLRTRGNLTIVPSPTSETVLTVAAFGVISFIVILVVVVIVLVGVVSLRFKCRKNKESEDPQKPGNSGVSESCSTANGEKDSITLISVKNINMNNSKGCPSAEKVL